MKKQSKILSIILALCTVLTVFAFPASAVAKDINAGSSMSTATNIPSYGVDYVSSRSKSEEQDWFKFTTKSNEAFYTITMKNYNIPARGISEDALHVVLYDKNMQNLGQSYCGKEGSCTIKLKLEKNTTYYLLIKNGDYWVYDSYEHTGNYQITVEYRNDNTLDTMSDASSVSLNYTKIETLDGRGDNDWYKFTTASKKADYTINLKNYDISGGYSQTNCLNIILYDKYMQNLGQKGCVTGDTVTINATLEPNTTYYLVIRMGSDWVYDVDDHIGTYEFSVKTDAVAPSKTLKSISVTSLPSKTEYAMGESLNTSGLVVKAAYTDGTSENLSNGSYTVSGFSSSSEGKKTITVSATIGGVTKTATFTVTVKDKQSGGETGGGTGGGTTIFNNITNVINNIFITIKTPFEQLINLIRGLFTKIFG